MDIVKQVIDQRVRKIIKENPDLDIFGNDDERNLSRAFLLLGVATYFDKDITDIVSFITEGGGDGGFDAAYLEPDDNTLRVTFFQAKYTRNLEKETRFPANSVEKAIMTIRSVFDPASSILLNKNSRRVVDQIRSYISDGYIPFVTYVMLNNGSKWDIDGDNKINNEFNALSPVEFIHFNHIDIINSIARGKSIVVKYHFEQKKEEYYNLAERKLAALLEKEYFKPASQIDGRSLSAFFRRFEFIEKVLFPDIV